ncbi:type IV pilus modification protein PilV [Atopomonas hussainii]|uniref:type IV pilus modification protein PilV n=1 Tax=Atopomonas hussainii TaxID=1429083 RepID=UPI00090012FB|nr:type IV pilus modification protein PilV [Atopomonas hussainii]
MRTVNQHQAGASLIEVLVALLIFTIGLLGFAALQLSALQNTSDSAQRSQATWVLQDLAERIRANPQAAITEYTTGAVCTDLPAKICSDHINPISGNKVNAEACSATEMATFDRWEAQCSYAATATYQANSVSGSARYTSRDFISAPSSGQPISVTASGSVLTLTANWFSKGVQSQQSNASSNLNSSLEVVR